MYVSKEEKGKRKEMVWMAFPSRPTVSQLDCMFMHLALHLTDSTES